LRYLACRQDAVAQLAATLTSASKHAQRTCRALQKQGAVRRIKDCRRPERLFGTQSRQKSPSQLTRSPPTLLLRRRVLGLSPTPHNSSSPLSLPPLLLLLLLLRPLWKLLPLAWGDNELPLYCLCCCCRESCIPASSPGSILGDRDRNIPSAPPPSDASALSAAAAAAAAAVAAAAVVPVVAKGLCTPITPTTGDPGLLRQLLLPPLLPRRLSQPPLLPEPPPGWPSAASTAAAAAASRRCRVAAAVGW
jgi:hypothetical protein